MKGPDGHRSQDALQVHFPEQEIVPRTDCRDSDQPSSAAAVPAEERSTRGVRMCTIYK